jgi:hypothetical protein
MSLFWRAGTLTLPNDAWLTTSGLLAQKNKELFYVGTKDFGYNENWIVRLEPRDRSNQWNRVRSDVLELDAKASRIVPRDNYISLMKPVVRDGYIPITDADGRLISIDRIHLTKYGAILFGQRVLLGSRYGEIMMQRGGSHLPTDMLPR